MQKHRRTLELKVVPIGNSGGVRLPKALIDKDAMRETVLLEREDGQVICAGRAAEIAVDQIRTISRERLGKRLDALDRPKAAQVRQLVTVMYGE